LNPGAGEARKEVLFTRKKDVLYAILPRYPKGDLVIRDLTLVKSARIKLLGSEDDVVWSQRGSDVLISTPNLADGALPFEGPRTFRIEGVQ
jgi:alpha-L-fucosidase